MCDRAKLDELNIQVAILRDNIARTMSEPCRKMYRAALEVVLAKHAALVEGMFRG